MEEAYSGGNCKCRGDLYLDEYMPVDSCAGSFCQQNQRALPSAIYLVGGKFCGSFILRTGDLLWFAGTYFCGSGRLKFLLGTNFFGCLFK